VALFDTKLNTRVLRPGLSRLFGGYPKAPNRLDTTTIDGVDQAFERFLADAELVARTVTNLRRKNAPARARPPNVRPVEYCS
jgi:hypothetical protein